MCTDANLELKSTMLRKIFSHMKEKVEVNGVEVVFIAQRIFFVNMTQQINNYAFVIMVHY